jgi:hypothetical protein
MRLTRSIALVCLACMPISLGAQAAEPKLPRNAVVIESSSFPDNGNQITFGSTTLGKGKKGRILRVDLRVEFADIMAFTTNGSAAVYVNGMLLAVSYGAGGSGCGMASTCNVEGSGWLDLDAAEQASPGVFVGQPLEIEVRGSVNSQIQAQVDVSLLAQLLRK